MASSDPRDIDAESATGTTSPSDSKAPEDRPARRLSSSRVISAAERDRMLREARDTDFPVGLRGYERAAVDRYVERVTRVITELEMSSSPESAVRHALEEVSEETRDILQRAHQTADEITARSRAKADDRLQQSEREAHELLDSAQREAGETREAAQREAAELRETTMRELAELKESSAREVQQRGAAAQTDADEVRRSARQAADEMLQAAEARRRELARSAETIWRERRRLIDDVRAVGEQLVAIGESEGKRFSRPVDEHSAEQTAEPGSTPVGLTPDDPSATSTGQ